ncbi:ERI1 exoribonuclease 3 [Chionoecetes opilio]|uniref:ERI1 exoribonuclease 3 n=1 Tax=Chionoecetes opilio TaxID=41210 RepID=A0A8J5CWV1_CHIOP|nr:ERI1 exoribonuclease 3 [Chionoecetes opilio]
MLSYLSITSCRVGWANARAKHTLHHFSSRIRQQQQHLKRSAKMKRPQQFDYFLVLDFEATCDDKKKMNPQEIIEFPVLKVNAQTYEIEKEFRQFVRPMNHPKLSHFCTELTSIQQEDVDSAKPFSEVFEDFKEWMEQKVGLDKECLFVTCGNWDLLTMLPSQCALDNLPVPPYCKRWLNIKRSYAIKKGEFVKGMMPMLKGLNLQHIGRHHSGLDDCKNIVNILRALDDLDCMFLPTYYTE